MSIELRQSAVLLFCIVCLPFFSCREKEKPPLRSSVAAINLKRGEIVLCGPADKQFGKVGFETSCSSKIKEAFSMGIALLHSFEYDEAEKVFAKIIDSTPECAMAYWGVAMANYHPLWAPPVKDELEKGTRAITIAQSIKLKSEKESDYIDAIALFYKDWEKLDHSTRSTSFKNAMKNIYKKYPANDEAAIFYALSLTASADPTDKSYRNQKEAAAVLNAIYKREPDHPGIVHYIIHTYDNPDLASYGLEAARKYASIAPSSAHALHMPSHIFTRLGLWSDCISANLASVSSAQCYAESTGMKGHWDEELHGLDYLVYAYLQKGDNENAKKNCEYLKSINEVHPVNFKVAYAFAAIPSRYLLENRKWKEAAANNFPAVVNWDQYPWQKSIVHFTRLLGFVHLGKLESANAELATMRKLYDILINEKDLYKANQVMVQITASEAWISFKKKNNDKALEKMYAAADLEDKTEKHPVTPGEVLPARELLGDMLLAMNKAEKALEAYELNLKMRPNRFNSLYGAGLAAEFSHDPEKAARYFQALANISNVELSSRKELKVANEFLKKLSLAH
jgi:tetratricopeptide (TPR) repeat protein